MIGGWDCGALDPLPAYVVTSRCNLISFAAMEWRSLQSVQGASIVAGVLGLVSLLALTVFDVGAHFSEANEHLRKRWASWASPRWRCSGFLMQRASYSSGGRIRLNRHTPIGPHFNCPTFRNRYRPEGSRRIREGR
jgi:hypothetical protein